MKIQAKDGEWQLSYGFIRHGEDRYPVDLPSLAEFLGLFPEELLGMIAERREVHLESCALGEYVGA